MSNSVFITDEDKALLVKIKQLKQFLYLTPYINKNCFIGKVTSTYSVKHE